MWDKVKEYLTIVFAGGLWYGEKGKDVVEWIEKNKTTLYVLVGIIVVVLVLIYMRPYAAIASKTKR
ncbi:hypothetical protein ES705_37942 [subsurface metagenome]